MENKPLTFEIKYDGESLGYATWCHVCGKGFETGPDRCPHCDAPITDKEGN